MELTKKPFFLAPDDIKWVESTLADMTEDEKIGQLFCLACYTNDEQYLKFLASEIKVGGIMCRTMPATDVINTVQILQENSKIPMLISANLESGGNGITDEGTNMGNEMQVAATDDSDMAYKLGVVCGREGSAVGCNWSFSPIIDIDYNFRNPITNTRTFGSDAERVRIMGTEYVRGLQEHGVAAAIKHFPGDGVDERDQHLVTTVNTLSCEEWDSSYGTVYKACIDAGAKTVMIGHIMQPAYTRKLNPNIEDDAILPASLSYELVTMLLKKQLGFNGLIVTDSTTMAGMVIPMPRNRAVPQAIAAGCDMFLFSRSFEEDYGYMKKGVEDGVITKERLDEAVLKILALKASLKLHLSEENCILSPQLDTALKVLAKSEHKDWAYECADKSITLVKHERDVLPLALSKYKKVLLYGIESGPGFFDPVKADHVDKFKKMLENEGFGVELFNPNQGMEGMMTPFGNVTSNYDLILYLANLSTKSNQTAVRIEWTQPMGANVPIYISSVPTIFISIANPYHLLDVPRVRTFINAYNSSDYVLKALVEKLMGRSEFKGSSPIDPFCGKWDTRL